MLPLLRQLLRDRWIWSQALLVTAFNVAMYSWYALGPFVFERLHWPLAWFGASGAVLALGSALGAWGNGRLLRAGVAAATRIRIAAGLVLTGGLLAALLHDHPALVAAMVPVVTGFGSHSQCARPGPARLSTLSRQRRRAVRPALLPVDRCGNGVGWCSAAAGTDRYRVWPAGLVAAATASRCNLGMAANGAHCARLPGTALIRWLSCALPHPADAHDHHHRRTGPRQC